MNPQHEQFVRAYLTVTNGNATQAAIQAGYSPKTAAQSASRLLKRDDIRQAIGKRLDKADLRTQARLEKLGQIADATPKAYTGSDVLKANELILKVNGALQDKPSDSRITVNIGFLQPPTQPTTVEVTSDGHVALDGVVMPSQPQVSAVSSDSALVSADRPVGSAE